VAPALDRDGARCMGIFSERRDKLVAAVVDLRSSVPV
jgi:hypothetical protein